MGGIVLYPRKENVTDIIGKMDGLSAGEKMHLESIIDGISCRQEELFEEIKKQVKTELNTNETERIEIYTALVNKSDIKEVSEYYLFQMCSGAEPLHEEILHLENEAFEENEYIPCGVVFFDGFYNKTNTILTESFEAEWKQDGMESKPVYYELRPLDIFVEKEKKIQQIAIQYRIETPLIYNPMARRAFQIYVKCPAEITKNDTVWIDFKFKYNNLENILLDKVLLWNVCEKRFEELPPAKQGDYKEILPLWDDTFAIYRFPTKNKNSSIIDYIWVENDLRIIKRVGDNIYWQMKKDYSEMVYEKYSVCKVESYVVERLEAKGIRLFHNTYEVPSLGEVYRIRTKGEIFSCLSSFINMGIRCMEVFTSSKEALKSGKEVIYTYPRHFDYYQVKDERLKCPSQCVIVFEKTEDNFFIDKVSYVISYLNHRYPEYQWLGVC